MVVAHTHSRHIIYIYAAADATHAEHILTLQVGAVAPPQHLHHQVVVAALQHGSDVKLGHVAFALCVAHVGSVEIYERCAVNGAEAQYGALSQPLVVHPERALVSAHGVDAVVLAAIVVAGSRLDERRGVRVRIVHVAVDGAVVALHLPARGHLDLVPCLCCLSRNGSSVGPQVGRGHEVELPLAVEALHAAALALRPGQVVVRLVAQHRSLVGIRHVVGHRGELINGEHRLVLPHRSLYLGFADLLDAEPAVAVVLVDVGNLHLAATHGEHAVLVGAHDAPHSLLSLHRLQAHQRVAPVARVCRPLDKAVDALAVAAVVEVLAIEGAAHYVAVGCQRFDGPVLPSVERVNFLGHHLSVVAAVVTVAEHQLGLSH